MSDKVKNIKLSWPHEPANLPPRATQEQYEKAARYRVEQIADSVEYNPGQMLDRMLVNSLCHSQRWKVTIVPLNK